MGLAEEKPELSCRSRVASYISELADRCEESEQVPSAALRDEDLEALDQEESEFVLRVGLISLVNDELHARRRTNSLLDDEVEGNGEDSSGKGYAPRTNPIHAMQGRNPTFWGNLGRIRLQAADGAERSLLRFTVEDWRGMVDRFSAQRDAAARRADFGRQCLRLQSQTGAERLEDLPPEVLAELDERAAEAFG